MVVDNGIGYDAVFLQSIWHDTSVEHEELNSARNCDWIAGTVNLKRQMHPDYVSLVKRVSDTVLYRINSFLVGMLALMSPFMTIRAWYDGAGAIDINKHGGDEVSMSRVFVLTCILGKDGRTHTQQWEWMDIFKLPQAIRFSWCKFTHKYLNLMPNMRGKSNALHAILSLLSHH